MPTDDPRIFASTADAKRATGYAGFIDERLRIDGQRADATISDRILGAVLTRTMDSAASLELTLWDGDLLLLRSGLFDRKGKPTKKQAKIENFDRAAWDRFGLSEVTLDGAFFRLAGVSGQYGSPPYTLTVTFEDRIASLMRRLDSHVKASRSIETRAEFLHWLARRAMLKTGIPFGFYSPEEGQRQKPKKPDTKAYEKGISRADQRDLTVAGAAMDDDQRRNAEIVLSVADDEKASERATLAAFCAAIGESNIRAIPNAAGSGYAGVFQADPANVPSADTKGQAHYFFVGGKGFQGGGAIALARSHPDWSPGKIALTVEGSRANFASDAQAEAHYQQWATEAAAILDAWGGVSTVQVSHQQYAYEAGGKLEPTDAKNENYWAATKRLTDQVRWRRWASENILWYVTDEWLFQRRPVFVLDDGIDTDGLTGLTFDADIGVPIAEIRMSARTARWEGAPGAVVSVRELGPLSGRWLTWEDIHDCLRETSDITLHRPAPKVKEEAAKTRAKTTTETAPDKGTARDRIVTTARKAYRQRSRYRYAGLRPYPATLFPEASVSLVHIDCSSFVTMVYREAGVVDPNGRGYDGQTNTSTLRANGKKTSDPQPGDLAHWGSGAPGPGSHVGIYIGDGQVIEMGGTPGPLKLPVTYGAGGKTFAGYWTYDLSDA